MLLLHHDAAGAGIECRVSLAHVQRDVKDAICDVGDCTATSVLIGQRTMLPIRLKRIQEVKGDGRDGADQKGRSVVRFKSRQQLAGSDGLDSVCKKVSCGNQPLGE